MKKNILVFICICFCVANVHAQKKTFVNIIEQKGNQIKLASLLILEESKSLLEHPKFIRQEEIKRLYGIDYTYAEVVKLKPDVRLINLEELYCTYKIDNKYLELPLYINGSLCTMCETLLIDPNNIESVKVVNYEKVKGVEISTKGRPLGKNIR
ncbi:MAG TPA: hypothetical protein VL125_03925 [Pelobium sp.]|nr:hypothetical protein [Pelobium sp.]